MLSRKFSICRFVFHQASPRLWFSLGFSTILSDCLAIYVVLYSYWLVSTVVYLQDELDNQEHIMSSRQYQSLNEQVQYLRTEVEKYRAMADQLQVFIMRSSSFTVPAANFRYFHLSCWLNVTGFHMFVTTVLDRMVQINLILLLRWFLCYEVDGCLIFSIFVCVPRRSKISMGPAKLGTGI